MGPVLIFDKSTIQSLSAGEAQWLTHMYFSNITPVLFLEIRADLKKMSSSERTPEQWVSGLAKKFSPINSLELLAERPERGGLFLGRAGRTGAGGQAGAVR